MQTLRVLQIISATCLRGLVIKNSSQICPTHPRCLQQKIESKLEQSLGSRLDIQLEQKMGIFQANMLEAMKSLREDFQKSIQKTSSQVEVDQISASASKPGPSNTVPLDPSTPRPRPTTHSVESMEVEYGPALPPRLGTDPLRCVEDASDQPSNIVEDPSRLPSTRVKKHSHSLKQHDIVPSSASDRYSDQTDDPRPVSSRPKKHSDKNKHKSRSRYLPSSSEEDQSSVARHRSPKPYRKTFLIKTNLNMTQTHLTTGK